jgi:hypothetical protein
MVFYWRSLLTGTTEALDKMLGNAEGWRDFKVKTNQQGAATTVYAAFDPGLQGRYCPLRNRISRYADELLVDRT